MKPLNIKEKVSTVFSVAYGCPYNANNPDCIALPLRELPVLERLNTIQAMMEDELDKIISTHDLCKREWRRQLNKTD